MKNILFTLFAILILTSCSKDEEDWTELNSNNIIGYWSTGIEGTHKLLSFDEDGTGSLEFTAMLLQFPFKCSIIKSRKVESIFMMYIQMKRLHII